MVWRRWTIRRGNKTKKPQKKRMAGAAELSEQIVPGGCKQQCPPKIEPAERPPPERIESGESTRPKGMGYTSSKGVVEDG